MSVIRQFGSTSVFFACIVGLQACAVAPERSAPGEVEDDLKGMQVSDELNDLREGDMAQFLTGTLAKFGTISIGREYNAASGRSCKQIFDASGQQLLSVACQLPTNRWYIRESLHVPGNTGQLVPVETDANQLLLPVIPATLESTPATGDKLEFSKADKLLVERK